MFLQSLFLGMMYPPNPFSQLTSTNIQVSPPSNCFLDPEKDDLYINRSNTPNPILSSDDLTTSKQDLVEGLGLEQCDHEYDNLFWSEVKKEKVLKKDHHSKIHTPHGLRDRRVRLSIEVAKKFFYLQDLLGDDKASKTLEWLFSKSKVSIDELIKRRKESSSSTVTDRSEVVFMEAGELQDKRRKKKSVEGKKKWITRRCKSGYAVNQSRAEARARARERTKEKLNIKKLDDESKSVQVDCCSSNLTLQSSFWSSIESLNDYDDKIGESVADDKISMLYGYQHNVAVPNDSSSEFTGFPKFTDLHEQLGDSATI